MSKGQKGAKSWGRTCPICGKRYVETNFMRRYTLDGVVVDWYIRDIHPEYPYISTDTHILACRKKIQSLPGKVKG
jgi:hypothetical protein